MQSEFGLACGSKTVDIELEKNFFELFMLKGRAERFVDRLSNSKKRHKIWDDLRDTRYFAKDALIRVGPKDREPEAILERLRSAGFSCTVYLMSPDEEFDGTEAALKDVLETIWDSEEVLAFCSKSKLGFFKSHEDEFFILQHRRP